ncbi:flagellar biosynthetic protein FliO [Thauera aromatica]|uniref:Flagellar protein n=1 Tax=Thauera aromatica K172 TaxID=44139 RepID=A0A2R4BJC0_THAAR|nr:flagellar biosynthetic protein FliO [Thauera aromatica]AVR87294.1 Flagellar biosynthesis protein FliO [Thauera aromatica K172]MCK2097283.1 flagellar biosynthetic protein FliO [Thauera aromatica]
MSASPAASAALEAGAADSLFGLALFGRSAAALALVLVLIFACAALLRRFGPARVAGAGCRLRRVGTLALGGRERVEVVEVEGRWLVLGVGAGGVRLLERIEPAPAAAAAPARSFATELRARTGAGNPPEAP